MTATLLDGNAFLEHVKEDLRARIKALGERGITPGLGTILVGADPNSAAYIRGKRADSAEVGIASFHVELPETATQADVARARSTSSTTPLTSTRSSCNSRCRRVSTTRPRSMRSTLAKTPTDSTRSTSGD